MPEILLPATLPSVRPPRYRPLARLRSAAVPARLVWMLLAQMFPLVGLAVLYPTIADRLESTSVGGVDLATLIVASAVVSPLLSNAVSAPVYTALVGVPRSDTGAVVRAVARGLPFGLSVALVLGAATGAVAHLVLDWSLASAGAIGALIALNLTMTALLVPAFALGSGTALIFAWSAYALALALMPTVWWLPPVAAAATRVPAMVRHAVGRPSAAPAGRLVGGSRAIVALLRGVCEAFPLWSIPIAVFLADPGRFSAGIVFGGFAPALIAYHVYFLTVAEPMWSRIDRMHRSLSSASYSTVRREIAEMSHLAHRGNSRAVVVLLVAFLVAAMTLRPALAEVPLLVGVMLASGAAVVVMTQTYTLSMLSGERQLPLTVPLVALTIAAVIGVCLSIGASVAVLLLAIAVAALLATATVSGVGLVAWRLPEHALFWRSALGR